MKNTRTRLINPFLEIPTTRVGLFLFKVSLVLFALMIGAAALALSYLITTMLMRFFF